MVLDGLAPISLGLFRADPQAFAVALRRDFEATGFAVIDDHGLDQPLIKAMIVDHRETGGLEVAPERHGEGLRVGPEQAKGNRRQPVQNQPSVS